MKIRYFKTKAEACNFRGAQGEMFFVKEDCSLRMANGCDCDGKILNPASLTEEEVKAIALACVIENDKNTTVTSGEVDGTDLTITDSDGNETVIDVSSLISPPVVPESGNYATGVGSVDVAAQTLTLETVNDETEAAGPPIVTDLSALFTALTSPDFPTFAGAVVYDAATNTYTFTDTDTDTAATLSGNTITFANGDTLTIVPDDDVESVELTVSGQTFSVAVAEGGNTFVGNLPIPNAELCETDSKVMVIAGGEMKFKNSAEFKTTMGGFNRTAQGVTVVSGTAIDAIVGTVIHDLEMEITNFHPCYLHNYSVHFSTLLRYRYAVGTKQRISYNNNFLDVTPTEVGAGWNDVDNRTMWEDFADEPSFLAYRSNFHESTFTGKRQAVGATSTLRRQIILNFGLYESDPLNVVSVGLSQMRLGHSVHAPLLSV